MRKAIVILLAMTVYMSGCSQPSHERPHPKMEETFSTKIEEDGTKLFAFTLQMSMPDGGRRGGGRGPAGMGGPGGEGRGGPGGGRGGMNHEDREARMQARKLQMETEFENRLSDKMVETGYCQSGYIEVDRNFGRGFMMLHGKCRDSATDEDRTKFQN